MSLRHDAFLYDSDETFVAQMGAHLQDGLRAGAHAVAVTTQHNLGLLRESLGADVANVVCIDREEWYQHPARVLAGFDRVVRDAKAAGAPSVYAIGEVRFGTTPREWDRWTAYEATIDRALADCKLNVICPYDERVLPAAVLAGACTTHEHVITDARRPSAAYADAAAVVRAHTPAPEPLPQLRARRRRRHARAARAAGRRDGGRRRPRRRDPRHAARRERGLHERPPARRRRDGGVRGPRRHALRLRDRRRRGGPRRSAGRLPAAAASRSAAARACGSRARRRARSSCCARTAAG